MQDRYAGDTPDFGKYLLLRHIQRTAGLQLGVNWYRSRPEEVDKKGNTDGGTRHHARLPELFEDMESGVYSMLRPFENHEYRCIENLENAGLFLGETSFFNEHLSFGIPRSGAARRIRLDWHVRAMEKLKSCQLIFCDPDTGPSPRSMLGKAHTKTGPKYTFPEEISAHLNSGQSVIVIRFIRQYKGGVEKAVRDTFELLEEQNSIDNLGLAVEFPSGKNATYFILPAADHKDVLYHAIDTLADSRIGSLFKRHTDYIR